MFLDNMPLDQSVPFRIGAGDSSHGSRLGGQLPLGVAPQYASQSNYLLTLQVEDDPVRELSIFLAPNWNDVIFDKALHIYSPQDKLIEIIVHGETIRDPSSQLHEILTPHPLLLKSIATDLMHTNTVLNRQTMHYEEIKTERISRELVFNRETWRFVDAIPATIDEDDLYDPEDVFPYSWHKLGGRPYLIKAHPNLVNSLIDIEDQGFRQLLQLGVPRFEDADVYGELPFGDGLFHLYYLNANGCYDWRYFWQN